MNKKIFPIIFWVICMLSNVGLAETIFLKDGDKITGGVSKISDEIILETKRDRINIKWIQSSGIKYQTDKQKTEKLKVETERKYTGAPGNKISKVTHYNSVKKNQTHVVIASILIPGSQFIFLDSEKEVKKYLPKKEEQTRNITGGTVGLGFILAAAFMKVDENKTIEEKIRTVKTRGDVYAAGMACLIREIILDNTYFQSIRQGTIFWLCCLPYLAIPSKERSDLLASVSVFAYILNIVYAATDVRLNNQTLQRKYMFDSYHYNGTIYAVYGFKF